MINKVLVALNCVPINYILERTDGLASCEQDKKMTSLCSYLHKLSKHPVEIKEVKLSLLSKVLLYSSLFTQTAQCKSLTFKEHLKHIFPTLYVFVPVCDCILH